MLMLIADITDIMTSLYTHSPPHGEASHSLTVPETVSPSPPDPTEFAQSCQLIVTH